MTKSCGIPSVEELFGQQQILIFLHLNEPFILSRFVISFKRLESKILGIGNTQQARHSLEGLEFILAIHSLEKHSQNVSLEFDLPVDVHADSI